MKIPETELLQFLKNIEEGRIVLDPIYEPQEVYTGNVLYTASNGWRIVIFNDANEWDYIDGVQAIDGRSVDFDDLQEMPIAGLYVPSSDIAWLRYRIPGYLRSRCTLCGVDLTEEPPRGAGFRCLACRHQENNP
jgi:hypothetical protein